MWDELARLVSKSAPVLGSALGSPLAGIGIGLLSDAFGVDKDKLLATITNNPDAIIKLKEIELKHAENFLAAQNAAYQIEVEDRKNARDREIQTRDHVPTFLSAGFLVIYAAIQCYCVTHVGSVNDLISARIQDVLIIIMSYYFGSSHKDRAPSE